METTASLAKLYPGIKSIKIGRGDPARPATKRTYSDPAMGLSEYQFVPLLEEGVVSTTGWQNKEREFFSSLSFLSELYGFEPLNTFDLPYPHNITSAFDHAKYMLQAAHPDVELFILSDERHLATLATYISFSTGFSLYYIPVAPLDQALRDKKRVSDARLLCSVFAYLHKTLEIDFYTEKRSYLNYNFEMMREMEYYGGEESAEEFLQELDRIMKKGKRIQRIILEPDHLRLFRRRVKTYRPGDEASSALHRIARCAMELYTEYPGRSIMACIPAGIQHLPQDDSGVTAIRGDQYLSFTWDLFDSLSEDMDEFINSDLQENIGTDEPMNWQIFDSPQSAITLSLDFEKRVFTLLEDLCNLLTSKTWRI